MTPKLQINPIFSKRTKFPDKPNYERSTNLKNHHISKEIQIKNETKISKEPEITKNNTKFRNKPK